MHWSGIDSFSREGPGLRKYAARDLAGLLSPMRVSLVGKPFGHTLELEPAPAANMLPAWLEVAHEQNARTLLRHGSAHGTAVVAEGNLPPSAVLGEHALVLTEVELAQCSTVLALPELSLVMIQGEVEDADRRAIDDAEANGHTALDAELRAVAAYHTHGDRFATVHVREFEDAARFVAEIFRRYLATLLNIGIDTFAIPEPGLIHRLLDESGELTVRPIETEIYSTAIDVGISTRSDGPGKPANQSLIYDVYANTWHGD